MTNIEPFPSRWKPRELPSNTEAEQGLLGAILIDPRVYERVSDYLHADHFFHPAHGRIWAAIESLNGQGRLANAVAIKGYFAADPEIDGSYLAELAGSVVTVTNAADYGRQILDLSRRRQAIEACDLRKTDLANMADDRSALDIVSDLETDLYKIAEGTEERSTWQTLSSALDKALEAAEAAYRHDGKLIGVTTGLIDLDKLLGGLRAPGLTILAGRPSMGKTALATSIGWKAAEAGKHVLFFSAEMSGNELATRIMAADAGVSGDAIRKGLVSADDLAALERSHRKLKNLPFAIDDRGGPTLAYMRNQARRHKRRHGLDLIVVDYLQLMRSSGKQRAENRTVEVGDFTQGLKAMAKEFDVPVLALSQLSRQVEQREDKRPQLSDLRESGSIEQDADVVMFVYREEYYVERERPTLRANETAEKLSERMEQWQNRLNACADLGEVIVGKQRHGPIGSVKLKWDGATTTFSDLAAYYDAGREM